MEPLSYTQSILDWHVVGHMTIPKKHASELDIPEMYVAPEPKDGKNAILKVPCEIWHFYEGKSLNLCLFCLLHKGLSMCHVQGMGGSQSDLEPTAWLSFYTWVQGKPQQSLSLSCYFLPFRLWKVHWNSGVEPDDLRSFPTQIFYDDRVGHTMSFNSFAEQEGVKFIFKDL